MNKYKYVFNFGILYILLNSDSGNFNTGFRKNRKRYRSYEDVLYTDGYMMVAKKGVAEQVGLVDGRHVLQNEVRKWPLY